MTLSNPQHPATEGEAMSDRTEAGATEWLDSIPKMAQRQDSTLCQVLDLRDVALRLGMYDAVDWLDVRIRQAVSSDS